MKLPQIMRFPNIGWVLLHIIAIPLVFSIGFLFCSWQFAAPAMP